MRPGRLTPMGSIWTTPGFADEKIWLFLGTELTQMSSSLQPDEILSVERMPLEAAADLACRGEICDAKSVCALLRASYLGKAAIA